MCDEYTKEDLIEAALYGQEWARERLGEPIERVEKEKQALQREIVSKDNEIKALRQEIERLKNQVAANHKALDEMVALTGKVDQNPQV